MGHSNISLWAFKIGSLTGDEAFLSFTALKTHKYFTFLSPASFIFLQTEQKKTFTSPTPSKCQSGFRACKHQPAEKWGAVLLWLWHWRPAALFVIHHFVYLDGWQPGRPACHVCVYVCAFARVSACFSFCDMESISPVSAYWSIPRGLRLPAMLLTCR